MRFATLVLAGLALFSSAQSFAAATCTSNNQCSKQIGCPKPDVPTCVDNWCTCRPGAGAQSGAAAVRDDGSGSHGAVKKEKKIKH